MEILLMFSILFNLLLIGAVVYLYRKYAPERFTMADAKLSNAWWIVLEKSRYDGSPRYSVFTHKGEQVRNIELGSVKFSSSKRELNVATLKIYFNWAPSKAFLAKELGIEFDEHGIAK